MPMKILLVYPESNQLIQQHVMMLTQGLRQSTDISAVSTAAAFRQLMKQQEEENQPDIIHVHGCSQFFLLRALRTARKAGIRTVITLHGQLEPWVLQQQKTQEMVRRWLLLREIITHTYAVSTLGRLERSNFESLNWNRRVEEIHNAVTTNTITPQVMCARTFAVYQKIIDSNTIEEMDDNSIETLTTIMKAGITGDIRWGAKRPEISPDWRRLLLYAEQENIRNYVDYGINLLGMSIPILDTSKINAYYPDNYIRPQPLKEIIGDYQGDENDYIVRMIRQVSKHPLLLHLIELTRELYRDNVNDERLISMLEDKGLTAYTARLMQVLSEVTRLDEGYMPVAPVDDKQTQRIRELLTNHLKI